MKIIAPDDGKARVGTRLKEDDGFTFDCHAGVACFNQCCRNLNLFLYPYDVLRLKNRLGISAAAFIDQYVDVVMREGNHFPDVLLTMSETEEKTCPFLTTDGCGVYPDRSYSCRMFPLEQGLQYDDAGINGHMVYFFRPPDFCRGRDEKRSLTVKEWIDDQDAGQYIRMTRQWAEIKSFFTADPWGAQGFAGTGGKMAFMAAYNMDAFADFLFHSSFLNRFQVPDDILVKIKADETELLLFGFEWIKHFIWGKTSPWLKPLSPPSKRSK